MSSIINVLKFIAAGAFVLALTGCAMGKPPNEDYQGKIWRGYVNTTILDTSTSDRSERNPVFVEATHFNATTDRGLRMGRVIFGRGFDFVIANSIVPDQIDFGDIPRGTLVDVMVVKGDDVDHRNANLTRIIGIVCKKDDAACLDREKAADRIRAVVDANPPPDLNARLGLTYKRRVTKEELKKYD